MYSYTPVPGAKYHKIWTLNSNTLIMKFIHMKDIHLKLIYPIKDDNSCHEKMQQWHKFISSFLCWSVSRLIDIIANVSTIQITEIRSGGVITIFDHFCLVIMRGIRFTLFFKRCFHVVLSLIYTKLTLVIAIPQCTAICQSHWHDTRNANKRSLSDWLYIELCQRANKLVTKCDDHHM